MTYTTQIEKNRAEKDNYMGKNPHSPLSHSQQRDFTGLDYYPIKEEYRFELPLNAYDDPETVEMDTSDGQLRQYRRIGYLEFEIEGEQSKIHIYQSARNPDHYFVPFRDSTSGNETYGAGRYLDIEQQGGVFELDFNKAYNPFCAYSDAYSCPLPPMENWLDIAIKAGEKDFSKN